MLSSIMEKKKQLWFSKSYLPFQEVFLIFVFLERYEKAFKFYQIDI